MDRLKTKTGVDASSWIFNTHNVFKWIQDFVENHIKKFLTGLFTTPGVFFYGDQTKLKCTTAVKNGSKIDLTIEAGMGNTPSGELIKLAAQIVSGTIDWPGDDVVRYLWLQFVQTTDTNSTYDVNRVPSSYASVNVHLMDTYTVNLAAAWPTGDDLADSIKIAKITTVGGSVDAVEDERIIATTFGMPSAAMTWVNANYHNTTPDPDEGFTQEGTTQDNFKIALGKSTEANLMIEFIPKPPLLIKVYDLNPHHGQKDSGIGKLHLKWNWTNLTGTPGGAGSDQITISGGDGDNLLDVDADDLVGYFLYSTDFVSANNKYLIIDNAATSGGNTLITLESPYDQETIPNKANIICGGDAIIVKRTNHIGESAPIEEDEVLSTHDDSRDIANEVIVNVQLGQNESIKMAAGRFGLQSAWTQMASIAGTDATYDPDHGTSEAAPQPPVIYLDGTPNSTVMMNMKLPYLNKSLPVAASITLAATAAGYEITVLGWNEPSLVDKIPHEYEVAYTDVGPNVDWTDPSTYKSFFTKDRVIAVAVALRDTYYVSIRPIQNKQIVCGTGDEVHGTIVSGGGGQAPNDLPIIQTIPFKIHTYSGTLLAAVDTAWYPLQTPQYPAVGDAASSTVSGDENLLSAVINKILGHQFGSILLDSNNKEFYILEGRLKDNKMQFLLGALDGSSTPSTGAAKINTTAAGRLVAELTKMTAEYKLTRIVANVREALTVTPSDPAIIQIKHNTTGGQFDAVEIEASNTYIEKGLDLEITGEEAELNLLVNLFDPSAGSPNNECSVVGSLTVYGRPKRVTTTSDDSGGGSHGGRRPY